jgi:hypothetical protein
MSRFLKWRYGVALGVVALIVAACSEAAKNPIAPNEFSAVPRFGLTTPGPNGENGECLAYDAFASGKVSGVNDSLDLASGHCTSNDINIAVAVLGGVSFDGGQTYTAYTGQSITCNPGDTIFAQMSALLDETATSARTDIGVWIATDGGNARTGTCNHYNLLNETGARASQDGGDACGDMSNAVNDTIPLGNIRLICNPGPGDSLHVGACLGWTQPGGDQVCPQGGLQTDNGYRWGTVPGTTAKCNCSGFNLPIIVNKFAKIEIKKVCQPSTDAGRFDLNIDGTPGSAAGDSAACGGSTGTVVKGAGTSANPGADYAITETGTVGTPLSNYNSSFVCTKNGSALSDGTGTSAGSIHVVAQDSVVCTFTNERKPQLTVTKICSPTTDGGRFDLQIDGATAGTGDDAACGTGTTGAVEVSIGSHTAGETAGTNTDLTNYFTPVFGGDCNASGVVSIAAGDNKTCKITTNRGAKLKGNHICVRSTDTVSFDVRRDGATAGTGDDAACGTGTTGAVEVSIGSHTAGEAAGTNTDLANYAEPVFGGDCDASGVVSLAAGDNKTCTITNTHTPHLTVTKICSPTTDGGRFDLQIDGATAGTGDDAACGTGTTGAVEVSIGSHTAGEAAGTNTVLGDYFAPVFGGDCDANGVVSIAAGDNKSCTITNTRRPVVSNGRILPTATTCEDYASGNATDLTALLATIRGNKIGTISPGVFFYYATVTITAGQVIGFTQSVTSPISTYPLYVVQQGQAFLYTYNGSSCTKVATLTLNSDGTAGSDGTSLAAGTYILGVKFTPANAKGTSVPTSLQDSGDLLATHYYQTTVNGTGQAATNASVNTNVK